MGTYYSDFQAFIYKTFLSVQISLWVQFLSHPAEVFLFYHLFASGSTGMADGQHYCLEALSSGVQWPSL